MRGDDRGEPVRLPIEKCPLPDGVARPEDPVHDTTRIAGLAPSADDEENRIARIALPENDISFWQLDEG